ncbi:MAG: ABC transporter ATP-binding protein, partial [Streptococcus sp.]|nr:ABC transporter ATP-binding protein [Streptococcus sp.]
MNTAIDVKQLSVTLGNRHILHDINVSVPIGKITTLIGPNGCGKSTLLRSMIGYIHSPHECITIFDKPLQSYSQNNLARQMAFLPQVPNMPKDMTVEELVYCGRYPYQTWWKNTAKEDREIVDYALHITKTNHLREQLIPSLSGGERQRVWIAMALAQQPKL